MLGAVPRVAAVVDVGLALVLSRGDSMTWGVADVVKAGLLENGVQPAK